MGQVRLFIPSFSSDLHLEAALTWLGNLCWAAAPMCGNALRCATKLVWERRHQLLPDWLWGHNHASSNGGPTLCVETPAGELVRVAGEGYWKEYANHPQRTGTMVAHLTVGCDGSLVEAVRVDMGKPNFARSAIPCSPLGSVGADASLPVLNENFTFNGVKYEFSSLVIGVCRYPSWNSLEALTWSLHPIRFRTRWYLLKILRNCLCTLSDLPSRRTCPSFRRALMSVSFTFSLATN